MQKPCRNERIFVDVSLKTKDASDILIMNMQTKIGGKKVVFKLVHSLVRDFRSRETVMMWKEGD